MRPVRALLFSLMVSLCLVLLVPSVSSASPGLSADFNQDGLVNTTDFNIHLANYQQFGQPHSSGDADGDTYVGVLCDASAILGQWSLGATGSAATVSATYDSTTGTGTVTVLPLAGGVSGIYLVNTAGAITTGPVISNSFLPDIVPPPVPPFGYPVTASAVSFYSGPFDTLGTLAPTSTTFSVPIATPIANLQFFYQRAAQAAQPVPVFDVVSSSTFTTADPFSCTCIVPEPSSILNSLVAFLLTFCGMTGRVRHSTM